MLSSNFQFASLRRNICNTKPWKTFKWNLVLLPSFHCEKALQIPVHSHNL